jgi:hypothetical protein
MPSALDVMLAIGRTRPCPWCHAPAGKPCRSEHGKGAELTKSVHPIRRKPTEVTP